MIASTVVGEVLGSSTFDRATGIGWLRRCAWARSVRCLQCQAIVRATLRMRRERGRQGAAESWRVPAIAHRRRKARRRRERGGMTSGHCSRLSRGRRSSGLARVRMTRSRIFAEPSGSLVAHIFVVHGGNVDMNVDAIHGRAGDFRNVALDHGSGALAVVAEATGLRVLSLLKDNSSICLYQRCEEETAERTCFMTPEEFYRGLEALGFTDCGVRSPIAPELRSYDPPERLGGVLSSVNVGRTVLDHETK